MSMDINVSVAMTTYNGALFIIEQLESIRNQTQPVDEVVIRDDLSSDDTVKIVRAYIEKHNLKTWHITVNRVNLGYADNFRHAILACRGRLIFLADQDDIWYPTKVEEMAAFMIHHPNIYSAASAYDICDSSGNIIEMELNDQWRSNDGGYKPISLNYFINGRRVRGASMCFRKEIIENEPIYDIGAFGHDTLISFYAIIRGGMVFYNRVLFKYRVHDNNTSSVALNKISRFSPRSLAKRVKNLNDDMSAMSKILDHQNLSIKYKEIMTKRVKFMMLRLHLIQSFSVKNAAKLIPYMKEYRMTSRHGFVGGCYTFMMDICFSLTFHKWIRDTSNDQS